MGPTGVVVPSTPGPNVTGGIGSGKRLGGGDPAPGHSGGSGLGPAADSDEPKAEGAVAAGGSGSPGANATIDPATTAQPDARAEAVTGGSSGSSGLSGGAIALITVLLLLLAGGLVAAALRCRARHPPALWSGNANYAENRTKSPVATYEEVEVSRAEIARHANPLYRQTEETHHANPLFPGEELAGVQRGGFVTALTSATGDAELYHIPIEEGTAPIDPGYLHVGGKVEDARPGGALSNGVYDSPTEPGPAVVDRGAVLNTTYSPAGARVMINAACGQAGPAEQARSTQA